LYYRKDKVGVIIVLTEQLGREAGRKVAPDLFIKVFTLSSMDRAVLRLWQIKLEPLEVIIHTLRYMEGIVVRH
jgi:hypothetical protein